GIALAYHPVPSPPSAPLFPYTTLFRSPERERPEPPAANPRRGAGRPGAAPAVALPPRNEGAGCDARAFRARGSPVGLARETLERSEEHTSELQSRGHVVCRLLLEKKNE